MNTREPIDATVSNAYRSIAAERTPGELDEAVLQEAKKEVRRAKDTEWRDAWYRPVTFVAVFGLSVALILQLSDSSLPGLPDAGDPPADGVTQVPANAFRDAAEATAEQLRQLDTTARPPSTSPKASSADADMSGADTVPDSATLLPSDDTCSEEQRATSGSWWDCIRELESRGLTASAERELQALMEAFPGFTAPD